MFLHALGKRTDHHHTGVHLLHNSAAVLAHKTGDLIPRLNLINLVFELKSAAV